MTTKAKRILFVDDNPYITDVMQDVIEALGYKASIVKNSKTALDLLRYQPYSFDLVITDMNMPGLDGIKLSKELLNIQPGLPIILCSGDSEGFDKEAVTDAGIRGFLAKPFSMETLEAAVNQALA